MQIWPAIDLRGGQCVRLQQGDFARETVFGDDPAAMALRWRSAGARRLHLVDLDGARDGKPTNLAAIAGIVQAVDIECQLGGGLRDAASIERMAATGVARMVIGTAALKDPAWFRDVAEQFPGRLLLGIDARDGWVATDGWLETSQTSAEDLAAQFNDAPLAGIVYTDIATDGMLAGPNVKAMARMQQATPHAVIASGGVTSEADVKQLAQIPMAGCIIGRALYEGKISLEGAMQAAGDNMQESSSQSNR